ncbi:MAG TPA: PHB depolymerase family esterase [Burkholderiales bacterium]|nr:PHB depolymerase family esterase [Burkholderiales bacterium]
MKSFWSRLAALARRVTARRAPPQPGRFTLRQKSSLHGLIGVAAAPPWREYLLYLPRGLERRTRPPLVVWLHGCRQDPEEFAAGTRIARYADERGFVVLLPRQNRLANAERCWNWFDRRTARGLGETAIVAAQASEVAESFGVDRRRIYLAGLSSGGALAAALALHSPRLFRAVAIHSGVPCGAAADAAAAAQVMAQGPKGGAEEAALQARAAAHGAARVPALIVHGAEDQTVAPVNAIHLARQFLLFNGFDPASLPPGAGLPRPGLVPLPFRAADRPDGEYYVGRRLAARLVTIAGLGHAWSGGDAAQPYFDGSHLEATRLVCDFFAAH